MRAGVITFILIACAVMVAVAMHNRPERTRLLVDAALPLRPEPPMLFAPCPLSQRNFRLYEERKA